MGGRWSIFAYCAVSMIQSLLNSKKLVEKNFPNNSFHVRIECKKYVNKTGMKTEDDFHATEKWQKRKASRLPHIC